jgi:hypothetical protein
MHAIQMRFERTRKDQHASSASENSEFGTLDPSLVYLEKQQNSHTPTTGAVNSKDKFWYT